MSKEALAKVVQRAISDASFRRQLNSDTAGALRGFDLTPDEVSALRAGDAGRLSTLGVDQRMSKSFMLGGGALAATKMAQSDLGTSNPSMIDDVSGAGSRTVIPSDPGATLTADDAGGGASTRSAIRDDPDGLLALKAKEAVTGSGRIGDDWKFTDRAAAGNAAPVEGSPEADAAAQTAGGMANYPAHHGLAGPSQLDSARAGDDWARSARIDDAARAGTARLDDASGVSGGPRAIRDDPDGFLASKAQAEATGGSAATSDAFVDESSEGYLTSVGYDANAASSAVTDAHDRADHAASPTSVPDDDGGASPAEGGPNITP